VCVCVCVCRGGEWIEVGHGASGGARASLRGERKWERAVESCAASSNGQACRVCLFMHSTEWKDSVRIEGYN
jgi:hypothetical protein